MATNGSEDVTKRASQLVTAAPASPALVHVSSTRVPYCGLQRRGLHTSEPSVAQLNVKVGRNKLLCVSGTTHRAFVHSDTCYSTVAKFDDVWSAGVSRAKKTVNGGPATGVAVKNSHCSSISLVSFPSPYQLEKAFHCYHSQKHLNSNRFSSRLLGKRAGSLQPTVHPICPPPKAAFHKSAAPPRSIMPSNQSSPWSTSKFMDDGNGFLQPTLPQVPVLPRPRLSGLEEHSMTTFPSTSHLCGMEGDCIKSPIRLACPTVPLQTKFQDLIKDDLCGVEDRSQRVKTVADIPLGCPDVHQGAKVLHGVRKGSAQVDFTVAVRKLAASGVKLKYAPVKDLYRAPASELASCFTLESVYGEEGNSTASLLTPAKSTCHSSVDQEVGLARANTLSRSSLDGYSCGSVCFAAASCGEATEGGASPGEEMDEGTYPQSPSVYSVATQISAIHLTLQSAQLPPPEDHSSYQPQLEDQGAMNCSVSNEQHREQSVVPGEEDELEHDCSEDEYDGSDCSSRNDVSSTIDVLILSNVKEPGTSDQEDSRVEKPALVPSLFPFRPPTLYFSTANERVKLLPPEQRKLLKWKMSSVTPNIVKQTIARSHFKATKKSHDWLGCWGHHMKSPGFKAIREYQKLNHFPGSFQIGRKDRLWRNLSKMQVRFGKQEFGFFPRSFVLPQDIKLLRKVWEEGGSRQKWIIKPPASARGIGIQVIHRWSQMPRRRPLLVQKYIHKPYLISGNKFDLRVYVYVSSYDPLRIYVFNDGLVRFASCKYSSSTKSLGNKFMHLTNYSVNKKNSEYQSNSDDKACQGHKWALKALWQYLGSKGIDTTRIWEKIRDMVIKTIIASDPYVNTLLKMHVRSPYSCHELFGFDIMLDENLKPWVLEVNISPSLHSSSPLDVAIKGQMIRDVLNLAGFVLPQQEEVVPSGTGSNCSSSSLSVGMRERLRHVPELISDEKVKRALFLSQHSTDQEFFSTVLDVLTPEDLWTLAEAEDELLRCGTFERVFPSPASSRYLRFFEHPRYLNILLDQWEQKYSQNRAKGIGLLKSLCDAAVHGGCAANPVHNWSSKSISGQRFGFCCNLSSLPEHVRSSFGGQSENHCTDERGGL